MRTDSGYSSIYAFAIIKPNKDLKCFEGPASWVQPELTKPLLILPDSARFRTGMLVSI